MKILFAFQFHDLFQFQQEYDLHELDGEYEMLDIIEGDQNASIHRDNWISSSNRSMSMIRRDENAYFHQVLSTPCVDEIVSASGPWIETVDGHRILDFHGNSVHQIGFSHPTVLSAVSKQFDSLSFCTRRFTNTIAVELAEKLISLAPGHLQDNSRVLLSPNGASAISIALKISRAYTGRYKTLSFAGSFHGANLDSSSIGDQDLFNSGMGPLLPGSLHIPPPQSDEHQQCSSDCSPTCKSPDCACSIIRVLEEHQDISAFIAEPFRSTTIHRGSTDYWYRIRQACDRTNTVLIFDEIPTGLGRSGSFWSSKTTGVAPDIVVIGKGLGGAIVPQAAVIAHDKFNNTGKVPVRDLALGHYTHEKSPIGCAAALATIRVIESQHLSQRAYALGSLWKELIESWSITNTAVKEVRQIGLMLAIELNDSDLAERVMYACYQNGLSFKIGNKSSIILCPPLNIETDLLKKASGIIHQAILKLSD